MLSVTPADAAADGSRPRAQSVLGVWQPARRRQGGAGIAPGRGRRAAAEPAADGQGVSRRRSKFDPCEITRALQCVPLHLAREPRHVRISHTIERAGENLLLRTEYMEIDARRLHGRPRIRRPGERPRQGHSVGRWEGDVLVVETASFADERLGRGPRHSVGPAEARRRALSVDGRRRDADRRISRSRIPEYLTEPVRGRRAMALRAAAQARAEQVRRRGRAEVSRRRLTEISWKQGQHGTMRDAAELARRLSQGARLDLQRSALE